MIKLLKGVRQKLLTEKRVVEYLIYAIGEIFLVVIGILIALQINNWNDDRKEKNLESQLINLLITDLEEKRAENIADITATNQMIERFEATIHMWETHHVIDTVNLRQNLRSLGGDSYFQNESSPIYAGLLSTNFWKQIPDSLNRQVDNIYRIRLKRVGVAFEKASEYGTHCKLNFLVTNDMIDLKQKTQVIQKKVEMVSDDYISYSKLFITTATRLKLRLEESKREIDKLIESLKRYNES